MYCIGGHTLSITATGRWSGKKGPKKLSHYLLSESRAVGKGKTAQKLQRPCLMYGPLHNALIALHNRSRTIKGCDFLLLQVSTENMLECVFRIPGGLTLWHYIYLERALKGPEA